MITKGFIINPLLITLIMSFSSTARAKSVYVISDTTSYGEKPSIIQAYKIADSNLIYQTDCQITRNAIDITIDTNSEYLFVTLEFQNKVELVNAKTMQYVGTVIAPGANNLAGIVMNTVKSKLYAVDRYTNHLYSWSWYPSDTRLAPDFINETYYIELEGLVWNGYSIGAFGIALDEENELLYVADNTNEIKYYDISDWSKQGQITTSCNVISIAIDVNNQLLYYGSMGSYGDGDPHLYQYDISEQNEITINVGTSVAGIAVDQQTSLIYLTTFGGQDDFPYPDPPYDRLMVYNSNLERLWYSDDIGNPAGVAVGGDVSYKPPFPSLSFNKTDDVNGCVEPGDYTTYTIYYDNPITDPNDPNYVGDVNNVIITDYLPKEVDPNNPFDANYDPASHTYTWNIGVLSPGDANSVTLTVRVNELAEPLQTITNYCEMENDLYRSFAALDTNICCWDVGIIYVDINALGLNTGLSWEDACTDLQVALEKARQCYAAQIWVAEGTYKPTTDPNQNATFELVDDVAIYGGFPPGGGSWHQRKPTIYETILDGSLGISLWVNYVVSSSNVSSAVLDGLTIKYGFQAGIFCEASSLAIKNSKIINNNYGTYDQGGVHCIGNSSLNITNCEISNNNGSGVYCSGCSSLMVMDCLIAGNISYSNSGGVHCELSGDLVVKSCIISDNEALSDGGGIYNDSNSSSTITNSLFTNNSGDYGAGLFNSSASPDVRNCVFVGNSADSYGGGIYNNYSSPTITNCVFNLNYAGESGGGIGNTNSSPTLTNCTFRANHAAGGGIYGGFGGGIFNYNSSSPNLTNCIFWDNTATQGGNEIYNYNDNCDPNFTYCDIEGGLNGPGCGGFPSNGHDNINYDPCFYEPDDPNEYHLGPNSPCIDTGDPNFEFIPGETDIDGEDRIIDGDSNGTKIVDIGADEYYKSPADFDNNDIVNFIDYCILANAWWSEQGDDDYNEICDLAVNSFIDYNDLALFCEDWLWQSGFYRQIEAD